MAKVHLNEYLPSSDHHQFTISRREVFTVWMKSLVMNSNGCTVFNSDGQIVYRVDNYDQKHVKYVYLMDQSGKTLSTIIRKKLWPFCRWEGFRSNFAEKSPWFQVRKSSQLLALKGTSYYKAIARQSNGISELPKRYRIEKLMNNTKKSIELMRIVDEGGAIVAEVKQKLSSSGVALGDDVLTLVIEPSADQLLMMELLIVHSLITNKL